MYNFTHLGVTLRTFTILLLLSFNIFANENCNYDFKELLKNSNLSLYNKLTILFPNPPKILKSLEEVKATNFLKEKLEELGKLDFYLNSKSMKLDPGLLQSLEPGNYSFIQFPHENFLRIQSESAQSHNYISLGVDVLSAGEIFIERIEGRNTIVKINNRSGHYLPPKDSLLYAITALDNNSILKERIIIEVYSSKEDKLVIDEMRL